MCLGVGGNLEKIHKGQDFVLLQKGLSGEELAAGGDLTREMH